MSSNKRYEPDISKLENLTFEEWDEAITLRNNVLSHFIQLICRHSGMGSDNKELKVTKDLYEKHTKELSFLKSNYPEYQI